jgi:pimeloyl-ACP methyl ester carboxylesterase
MTSLRAIAGSAIVAFVLGAVPHEAASSGGLELRPCTLAYGIQARCGTLTVPENRALAAGRTIALRIAVLPAGDGGSRRDPLVYITGGPGGSAVEAAAFVVNELSELNATRDVVLVDQRGTGGSNPLSCRAPKRPTATEAAVRAYVRDCLAEVSAEVKQYTTVPAMEDLADVVHAFGYEQVNLYGGSYGGTAVQYFLAQHPELVRTAIMDGATLIDVPLFERWAPNGQQALRSILARCAASKPCARRFPRVRREAFEVFAGLRRRPVRFRGTRIDIAVAADTIQLLTRTPAGAARIPLLAHRARARDWAPLAQTIRREQPSTPTQMMYWAIVCNEHWARQSPKRAAAASRGTYLAEARTLEARLSAAACSVMPKEPQPSWTLERVRSGKPVLLVVGGADPQDPLPNVAHAARELPNSRTVVVPGGGHGSVQLGCMPQVAFQFVERGSGAGLDTRCVARYRPPPFALR